MQPTSIEDVINELFDVLDEKIRWQPFDGFWLRTFRAAALAFAPLLLARLVAKGKAQAGQLVV
jgi:hypothetical protein